MRKMFVWVIVGLVVAGATFWFVTSNGPVPASPMSIVAIALVFVISPIGSFWMLYIVIRYEKRPMLYILLAFLPYFSLGYYFERVRGKRLTANWRD